MLPEQPHTRRMVLIAWLVAAVVGSVAVWWLSSYLEELTNLASTNRTAALDLFRTRALPALLLVVAVAVASGAMLLRQGLQMARTMEGAARTIGNLLAAAGFVLAAVPLALISVVLWMLRQN